MSPLWIAGLGLFALAFTLSAGGKQVSRVKRSFAKRRRRKEQVHQLKEQIRALKA